MRSAGASPPLTTIAALDGAGQAALRALNNAHAAETSHLEPGDWSSLVASARVALAAPDAAGFVIALAPGADYESENYCWFQSRFSAFLYVDRVVVAVHARGRGLARTFYGAVAGAAREGGLERVVCEVNRVPPNPVSDAVHERLGFREIATVALSPAKTVRYLELAVGSGAGLSAPPDR